MRVRTALALVLLPILGIVALCELHWSTYRKELKPMPMPSTNQLQPPITVPHEDVDSWRIPTIVTFNDEQRLYVSEVLAAMVRIMAESSTLEVEEERILGLGKFRWPKNPNEPVMILKSYPGENFRMRGITASFRRISENAPWSKAGLTVHPRNFPDGVYAMGLPSALFDGFALRKVVQEDRKEERIKNPIVFYLEHKKIANFTLKVEARADVASIENSFPPTFHAIVMARDPQ